MVGSPASAARDAHTFSLAAAGSALSAPSGPFQSYDKAA